MPCFKRENCESHPSRRIGANERDPLAPTPVHARAIKYHGLFSIPIASQHLVVDENWTPSSLSDQISGMAQLLGRHAIYKRHETKINRHLLLKQSRRLKTQCADGRLKLQLISFGNNAHKIRNILINHRGMQCLYQKMPIHLAVDKLKQRTFAMRKERDRLEFRLSQLKDQYKELLLDRGKIENLIKYKFVLDEGDQSSMLLRKLECSNVRLKAIRTINTTYKKIIQVLLHDEIFYEPILRSLEGDMKDQVNFIKHILYLGMPAISKFKQLNSDFNELEIKSRKNLQSKMRILSTLISQPPKITTWENASGNPNRYMRTTDSMMVLKMQLNSIETNIKEIKLVTMCSQAKLIYPSVKDQTESNVKLESKIEHDRQTRQMLQEKMKYATMLEGILINNLSDEEILRVKHIHNLKSTLEAEKAIESENLKFIRNRADAYVMFRINIWNLIEILRHVDNNPKTFSIPYPNSYLKLPLLKFELFPMYAVAPELYTLEVDKLMHILKRKVYKLKKKHTAEMDDEIDKSKEKYHTQYMESIYQFELGEEDQDRETGIGQDLLKEKKSLAQIPNRKQIRALSARVLEEVAKRD